MHPITVSETVHPAGESKIALASAVESELVIDTPGGRYRASFDDRTPVSALGPLVFFAQYLQASGQFEALCRNAPLVYRSPNAPAARDVVGTVVLGILAGALALRASLGAALRRGCSRLVGTEHDLQRG